MSTLAHLRGILPRTASRASHRAHRLFHPLCGATLPVLIRSLAAGDIAPRRAPTATICVGMALLRLPFTLAEAAYASVRVPAPGRYPAPVFVVGHWRSGTTHLANLLSRGGAVGNLSPMSVGLPAEALGLARIARPFIDQFFPAHRLIDDMRLDADLPQEDELAMANLSTLSSQHGIYFPRRIRAEFDRGLFGTGVSAAAHGAWAHAFERYVAKLTLAAGGRPLLIRNPASSSRIDVLRRIWPDARFIHIHRDPASVYGSAVRMFATLIREFSIGRDADAHAARDLVRHVYPRLIAALLDAAATLPAHIFTSISHASLEHDTAGTLDQVHAALRLPRTDSGSAAMVSYAAAHRRTVRTHPLDVADRDFLERHRQLFARLGYDLERSRRQA